MRIFRGMNPFKKGSIIYNRDFTLNLIAPSRETNAAAKESVVFIQDFVGAEPQMKQRVTENLVMLDNISAMQGTMFVIHTQERVFDTLVKSMRIQDQETDKEYRLLAYYRHVDGYDFIVTELSD